MSLNYVTLVLDMEDTQGNPINTGTVVFTPSAQLDAPSDHEVIVPVPVTVNLQFHNSISLLATDNTDTQPSGWVWNAVFKTPGGPGPLTFALPYANGAARYLSDLVPAVSAVSMASYLPLPSGMPQPGSVPVATGGGQNSVWDVAPGGLLATVCYAPVAPVMYTATYPAGVLDADNLTIAFDVPSSGNFYIDVGIDWSLSPTIAFTSVADLFLGVALHGTNAGTLLAPMHSVGGAGAPIPSVAGGYGHHRFYVSGYTPGALQADLCMCMSDITNVSGAFYSGPGNQPIWVDPTAPTLIQAFAA